MSAKNGTNNGRGPKVTEAQARQFVAERRAALERVSDAEIDKLTEVALASVDKNRVLSEARALREKSKSRTGPSVRRHSK